MLCKICSSDERLRMSDCATFKAVIIRSDRLDLTRLAGSGAIIILPIRLKRLEKGVIDKF